MTIFDDSDRRYTAPCQTKLTAADSQALDDFVYHLRTQGIPASRSSVLRAFLLEGLKTHHQKATP